jgi:thymidylate synthase ThyX
MKVTQVALCPTDASQAAGRPALTPELLAASGARYSRNNEGLEAILSKIDPNNLDKSVDGIFKMIDYGHQSIADMAPVAMFIDGVSMWLAYHIWSLCPTAGGQESSTRYIKLSGENLPDPEAIGIPEGKRGAWKTAMSGALDAYEKALTFWENEGKANPSATRIPRALLEDESEKAVKAVARMRRNYAFDRARYFLPAALPTNVMMVQSARAWTTLCQNLLSHPLAEAQKLGALIREELALAAPRLLRHAVAKESFQNGNNSILKRWQIAAKADPQPLAEAAPTAHLDVFATEGADFARDLAYHDNRYAFLGPDLCRAAIRFQWDAVALGDIRDLNRHRTGTKWCPLVPQGFYAAIDQTQNTAPVKFLQEIGRATSKAAKDALAEGDWTFVYHTLLGTQFPFEHTTTADKFLYEAELRTGLGAHYRYARHLHDALEIWFERFPETRDLVLEGSAEPE